MPPAVDSSICKDKKESGSSREKDCGRFMGRNHDTICYTDCLDNAVSLEEAEAAVGRPWETFSLVVKRQQYLELPAGTLGNALVVVRFRIVKVTFYPAVFEGDKTSQNQQSLTGCYLALQNAGENCSVSLTRMFSEPGKDLCILLSSQLLIHLAVVCKPSSTERSMFHALTSGYVLMHSATKTE